MTAVTAQTAEDVVAGTLVCADPACRAEYPIIDGIPIIMASLQQHLGERAVELLLRDDIEPQILSLIGDAMGPDSWLDSIRQTNSTYVWDSFAEQDPQERPATDLDPRPGAARRCLQALLTLVPEWDGSRARHVLDLGCGAGGSAFECAARMPGALVLGIDGNLALLRVARRAALAGQVRYGRRRIGLVYDDRRFAVSLPGAERVDFWACDATAMPVADESADLIVALNLLDCLPDPVSFLHAAARLLQPGAPLLLGTPFDWAARATPAAHWIGGHSQRGPGVGAAEPLLSSLLTPAAHPRAVETMSITGSSDVAWHTRLHDRAAVTYRAFLVAATKSTITPTLDKSS